MKELNFAILAIGDPGESGTRSLNSVLSLKPNKICMMVDQHGEAWLKNSVETYYKKKVCLHYIDKKVSTQLGIGLSTSHFHKYGEKHFMLLTALKWQIISESIKETKNSHFVVFTDLDVLWFKKPNTSKLDKSRVWLQNDSKPNSKNMHYCTGIMFWPRSNESIKYCKKLYKYQNKVNLSKNYIHDEQAFNKFIKSPGNKLRVEPLEVDSYLIGHRARKLLVKETDTLKKATAFHANYFKGASTKNLVIKSIESKTNSGIFWIYGLVRIYMGMFGTKIKFLNSHTLRNSRIIDKF
jgi:hypothetical protein